MTAYFNRRVVAHIIAVVACLGSIGACVAPQGGRTSEAAAQPSNLANTIFTDTALFRRTCLEADSGLTLPARRCTPRDQRVRVR